MRIKLRLQVFVIFMTLDDLNSNDGPTTGVNTGTTYSSATAGATVDSQEHPCPHCDKVGFLLYEKGKGIPIT